MAETPLDVLVVEDNPGDIRIIKMGFEKSGIEHSITHVSDGAEALDYLYQRNGYESGVSPDLTFLDLNVPKVSGRDVLDRMRGDLDLASIPVLVLSGSQAENHVRETHQLGADGYFVKPVDPDEFTSLVERVANSMVSSGTLPSGEYAALDVGE
jgi:CheY-like chemotaxis protein